MAARVLAVLAGLFLGNVGLGFLWGTPSLSYADASAFLVSCGKLPKDFDPQNDKTRPRVADAGPFNLGFYACHSPRLDYLPQCCGVPVPCQFRIVLSRVGPVCRVSRAEFSSASGTVVRLHLRTTTGSARREACAP